MTSTLQETFLTAGAIARQLGERVQRINYVISSRNIPSLGRVGIIRVYDRRVVEQVRSELKAIDQRRATVPAA